MHRGRTASVDLERNARSTADERDNAFAGARSIVVDGRAHIVSVAKHRRHFVTSDACLAHSHHTNVEADFVGGDRSPATIFGALPRYFVESRVFGRTFIATLRPSTAKTSTVGKRRKRVSSFPHRVHCAVPACCSLASKLRGRGQVSSAGTVGLQDELFGALLHSEAGGGSAIAFQASHRKEVTNAVSSAAEDALVWPLDRYLFATARGRGNPPRKRASAGRF